MMIKTTRSKVDIDLDAIKELLASYGIEDIDEQIKKHVSEIEELHRRFQFYLAFYKFEVFKPMDDFAKLLTVEEARRLKESLSNVILSMAEDGLPNPYPPGLLGELGQYIAKKQYEEKEGC